MFAWQREFLQRVRNLIDPPLADEVASYRRRWLRRTTAGLGLFGLLGLSGGALLLLLDERWGLFALGCGAVAVALSAAAYALLRYGYVWWAGHVPALAAWAGVSGVLWFGGWGGVLSAGYALAIALAVLFAGPVGGVLWTAASVLAYAVMSDPALSALRGDLFPGPGAAPRLDIVLLGAVWIALLALIAALERRLRSTAAHRAQEAHDHAAEREAATRARQEMLAQFARQVDRERALLAAVQQVDTPVLPLDARAVLVPLSGQLDEVRAERLIDALLAGVDRYHADRVLIDLSGLVALDARAAAALVRAIQGARLVGSACVLVGVRPPVARALAALDADLASISTYPTLREGLAAVREADRAGQLSPRPERARTA
ncbi:MAG: STAS domain-containing protein [Anaerolineae bacterium]|nr:STAS domain-containing protein [Anaerolineae bacterium]